MQNEQSPTPGQALTEADVAPHGYLVKDFADGWYWTPNAALECTDGAPVWNVSEARYETERRPHAAASDVAGGVEREAGLGRVYKAAYDTIRKGAPGLSDATCSVLARAINMKVALIRPAAPDAPGGGWRPIETAPKDGTEVLVMLAPKVIRLGWYFKPSSRTEGWCDESGKSIRPTHWMPLPAAPALQPGGER